MAHRPQARKPGFMARRQAGIPRPRTPTIQHRGQTHLTVMNNELWFGDGPPSLGKAFTAAETAKRHTLVIGLLYRAAKKAAKAKDTKLHDAYGDLADKLYHCKPKARCGSLACPQCARAFQKAKVSAQQTVITDLAADRSDKTLVFVSVVPKGMTYNPGKFSSIDIAKANRWLKDALKPIGTNRPIMGSADLGWESRRGGQYLQLHWHLALWTNDPDQLDVKLKEIFQRTQKHERPVDVTEAMDLGFLPYQNKAIKLPDLLRRNRKNLPELFLVLDQTDPMDLMVMMKLRLSAQDGTLTISRVVKPTNKSKM